MHSWWGGFSRCRWAKSEYKRIGIRACTWISQCRSWCVKLIALNPSFYWRIPAEASTASSAQNSQHSGLVVVLLLRCRSREHSNSWSLFSCGWFSCLHWLGCANRFGVKGKEIVGRLQSGKKVYIVVYSDGMHTTVLRLYWLLRPRRRFSFRVCNKQE